MIGKLDIELLGYRSCVVCINGQYWGVHNIREKFSKHYLNENYEIDEENIDLLEEDTTIIHGDFQAFNNMVDFITGKDMQIPENYDSASQLLDIHSFCDYIIAETYLSNIDWPKNNIKYWRVRESGWKWRYMLMDLDISLGNYGWAPAEMDVLGRLLGPYGAGIKHVQMLKSLFHNSTFREYFINRYADLVNTVFSTESLVETITGAKAVLEPEMPRHFTKWFTQTMEGWNSEIHEVAIPYALNRPFYARQFLQDTFGLDNQVGIRLDVWPPGSGAVNINSLINLHLPWEGIYFDEVPLNISARPFPGYRFLHWDSDCLNASESNQIVLTKSFSATSSITAIMISETDENEMIV